VPALLQPAAHALLQAVEDVERATAGLTEDDLWKRPGDAASVGFHLKHLAGATDRLMTYGRGDSLTVDQLEWVGLEKQEGESPLGLAGLVARFKAVVEDAVDELRSLPEELLTEERTIGRAQLPTTVLGCVSHAAEHASRHAGQLVTTIKLIRWSAEPTPPQPV
jgi:hypothetical protein